MCQFCHQQLTANPDCSHCRATQAYRDGLRRHEMKKTLKKQARRRQTLRRRAFKAFLIEHEHQCTPPVDQDRD